MRRRSFLSCGYSSFVTFTFRKLVKIEHIEIGWGNPETAKALQSFAKNPEAMRGTFWDSNQSLHHFLSSLATPTALLRLATDPGHCWAFWSNISPQLVVGQTPKKSRTNRFFAVLVTLVDGHELHRDLSTQKEVLFFQKNDHLDFTCETPPKLMEFHPRAEALQHQVGSQVFHRNGNWN